MFTHLRLHTEFSILDGVMHVSAALDAKIGADDVLMAIGGGSVLDVAGYAAAQVRGGVKLVRVPTTPAAMVDAAFAHYAAVDFREIKDALRIQCEPDAVIVDRSYAKTVLDGVWRGGLGEIVRFAASAISGNETTLPSANRAPPSQLASVVFHSELAPPFQTSDSEGIWT